MNEINVEVIGVNPPCKRCDATWKNVEKAASILRSEGVEVSVKKLDIASKDVVKRYGALMSPAVAVNGTVKIMGRVPESDEVEKILREAAK
ncbi:MAG: thioredoxin family protein [Candidatus Jordarchaeales archaeon]